MASSVDMMEALAQLNTCVTAACCPSAAPDSDGDPARCVDASNLGISEYSP